MKTCPQCQVKNEDSSRFCKACGQSFSNASFQDKKEKVLGEKKGKSTWLYLSLAVVIIGFAGIAYWLIQDGTTPNPKISSQQKVAERVDYTGQTLPMTDIEVKVENGKIAVPLKIILEKKFVRFEYEGKGVKIPRTVDKDRILIDEKVVLDWKPRV